MSAEPSALPPPPVAIRDLAKRHGVTEGTVRRWVNARTLCPVGGYRTPRRPLRFAVAEVVRFEQGAAR